MGLTITQSQKTVIPFIEAETSNIEIDDIAFDLLHLAKNCSYSPKSYEAGLLKDAGWDMLENPFKDEEDFQMNKHQALIDITRACINRRDECLEEDLQMSQSYQLEALING